MVSKPPLFLFVFSVCLTIHHVEIVQLFSEIGLKMELVFLIKKLKPQSRVLNAKNMTYDLTFITSNTFICNEILIKH